MNECYFGCGEPVDLDSDETYRRVTSWVNGPKLDHPVMREQTGEVAHAKCVALILAGQAVDQPELPLGGTVTLVQECFYEPVHTHEYPDDWQFAGPAGTDPRADPRWRGDTYVYLNVRLHEVHRTQVPLCDDEAIDKFTLVAEWGLDPVYLQVKRADGRELEVIPWQYDRAKDEVNPL